MSACEVRGLGIRHDDPQRHVFAEQLADLARRRFRQVAGPQVGRPDRVRLVEDDPAARVEPVGRHAHRHGEQERQERQDGAHDHAGGTFLLARRPLLPPATDPETAFVAEQADDHEQDEDRDDGQRVEELGGGHGRASLRCHAVEAEHVEGGLVEAIDTREPGVGAEAPHRGLADDRPDRRSRTLGHRRRQAGEDAEPVVRTLGVVRGRGEPVGGLLVGDQGDSARAQDPADRGEDARPAGSCRGPPR